MDEQQKECGTCKHWKKLPVNPANFRDRRGLCTEAPPSTTTLPQPNGQQVTMTSYPNIPAEFMACSRHALELVS